MEPIEQNSATEIRKEAAAWLVEIDDAPDELERREFVRWLRASPRHLEEFLLLAATWRAMDDMPRDGLAEVRRWLEESGAVIHLREPQPPLLAAQRSGAHNARPVVHRLSWATAVVFVAVLSTSAWLWYARDAGKPVTFATALGEQRVVKLADRSVVYLNTSSRVEVRFTDTARVVRLLEGEALFSVERDLQRPFRVQTGVIAVQAIGTQFNVRRTALTDIVVSIIDGRVAVIPTALVASPSPDHAVAPSTRVGPSKSPIQRSRPAKSPVDSAPEIAGALSVLVAGEQAHIHIGEDGAIEQRIVDDVTNATAWRERRLVFDATPLTEVVAEVNRYNLTPRLRLEDGAVSTRQVTGVFTADKPEFLIGFLEADPTLLIDRRGETVVIRSR